MATCPNINNPQWRFEQLGSPTGWRNQADQLKESADALLSHWLQHWNSVGKQAQPVDTDPSLSIDQSVLMYLYALAIENVVKGIIVARNPGKLQSGKIPWLRYGHNLSKLFSEAGLTDTCEEQHIGERFQHFLNWGGRYPIPKDKNTLMESPWAYQAFLSTNDFSKIYEPLRKILLNEIGKVNRL